MKYYKLEQRDMKNPSQTRSVYRLRNEGRVTAHDFIQAVSHRHGFSESVVAGVLIDVAKELAEQLGRGRSVELPDIGLFSVGVRMRREADETTEAGVVADATDASEAGVEATDEAGDASSTDPNARSLYLDHINFKKNKGFFNNVDHHFRRQDLQRAFGAEGIRIKKSKYPQLKNRMIVAREFLADHPFMTVRDYADITGLSKSTAQRELKQAWQNPAYGITVKGSGSHRVYVLRDKS